MVGVLDPAGPDLFTRTPSATFPNRVYAKVMSASGNAVFNKKLPITGEVGRRFVTH